MGKAIVILMIVLGVWIGLEIFTKGTDAAFGGVFASGDATAAQKAEPNQSPAQRIGARVQQQLKAGAVRSTSGLEESAPDEEMDPEDDGGSDEFGSEE